MKEIEFINYWNKEYPEALPIGYELKWIYQNRWFRIHSLPNSKRHAQTDDEYKIILDRQNELIEDLIGEGTEIAILFGLYIDNRTNDNYHELTDFGAFRKVLTIDLQKERPEEYENEMYFDIYTKIDNWHKDNKKEILKAIADDKIQVMFVCPSKHCIVAPYDGGVDVIVSSTEKRNELKIKYNDWLSEREDGM